MQTSLEKRPNTRKRMVIMVLSVLALIGVIAGIKVLMVMKMLSGMAPPPPAVVSTTRATIQEWQPTLNAVGTLRAARGSDLAFDVAGLVTEVNLKSGDEVKQGQLLVRLRDAEDFAQLRQLEATTALADVVFGRAQRQLTAQAISKADYDATAADFKAKQAAVAQQQAIVSKKHLRAPFAGRAGIITVSPGAYINMGTPIVTVQQLDPVFVDFHMPQRNLGLLQVGQNIGVTLDAFPGRTFSGTLSAISPKIDGDTRNVQIEARVANPDRVLAPGMFANVRVDVGAKLKRLTLPQTAVVYNPYGETVYVVKHRSEMPPDAGARPEKKSVPPPAKQTGKQQGAAAEDLVVQQVFVTTGGTRGDQVAVDKGLTEGAEVVSSGQIKLKNGAPITIDNSVQPADDANPKPQEH